MDLRAHQAGGNGGDLEWSGEAAALHFFDWPVEINALPRVVRKPDASMLAAAVAAEAARPGRVHHPREGRRAP
jgi:hypothetical protein